jgi:hypothetical protein
MKRLIIAAVILALLAACGSAQSTPLASTATPVPPPADTSTPLPPIAEHPVGTATPEPPILPTAVPGALTVDPSIDLGPISPYLYGTNYGPMQAVVAERMPDVESAGFTVLRFPAGAWSDQMDLIPFQIDMFMSFCKQVGATPTITVRLLNGTPAKAAELVRYANIEKKYGVVYWSIGNEPNLYESQHQGPYDTVKFNPQWRAIAQAMKAVDPSIKLMGPETSQWNSSYSTTPKDAAGKDWMTEFLKANGDLVDIITVHRYPMYSPTNGPVTVEQLRQDTRTWLAQIDYLNRLVFKQTGKHLPQAWTEVNSDPSATMFNPASPDSFYNAIWYADVLGQMMQGKVFMVNQWVISQRSGGLGLLYGPTIRPTFYVFPLYKHFGSEQVFAASGMKDVDIFAATQDDGALTLMVINLGDTDQKVPLKVTGAASKSAEVWRLDKDHNAENIGTLALPADGMLTLPAQSVSLFVIGNP